MGTKKYWQTLDDLGRYEVYANSKPETYKDELGRVKFSAAGGKYLGNIHLFPIPLKPLQIAEITVNEDGTWSYEIEREEGWYFVKHKSRNEVTLWRYKSGEWHYAIGGMVDDYNFDDVKISSTRIPDECII